MVSQEAIYWEDPILKRWFDTIVKKGTKYSYRTAFRAYIQYTGLMPSAMIDEGLEDSKRDPRQKKDVLLTRILGFYQWLKTEYRACL